MSLLPPGCRLHRNGLALPPNLKVEEWAAIGRQVAELAGSTMWVLGDFFAYGLENYHDKVWGGRVPDGLYDKFATQTGLSVQALTNAKYVCSSLPLSRRREKLTFAHAYEIVSRASEGQQEFWVSKAVDGGLTVKALREQLRKASAQHREEPNDTGETSPLEITRQFVRDFLAAEKRLTPDGRREVLSILKPVLEAVG